MSEPAIAPQDPRGCALPVRVYYEDTDSGGVVYHANYLRYMERGRTEWLRGLGFDQRALAGALGVLFTLRRMEIDFLRPARLDDQLTVRTALRRLRPVAIEFDQHIEHADGRRLCSAVAQVVCVDAGRFRPAPIPPAILKELGSGN